MSLSLVTILVVLLLQPLSHVTCTRHHEQRQRGGIGQLGSRDHGAGEFAKWVERVGKKHRLKLQQQEARAKHRENGSELDVQDPSLAPPDLSAMFPGLKQYSDWESVVSPATYIVVDQDGLGNFRGVKEAIDSIPGDPSRRYRITIQVNAGTYR